MRQEPTPSPADAAIAAEPHFSAVADAAPVLIWIADPDETCTWFNQPWLAFSGRSLADEVRLGWGDAVHPDDRARCARQCAEAFASRTPFRMDYRRRRHDGAWRVMDDHGVPRFADDGRFLGYIGCCLDVTEARATEAALRASEEQLRLATEAGAIGLWDLDLLTDALYWPPRVKAMFGLPADAPVTMDDFYAGLHPQDLQRTTAAFAAALDPVQRAEYHVEYRTVGRKDGVLRWVEARGRGIFDADGRCVRVIGTAIDISDRKQAEQRLQDSENELAQAMAALDGLMASAPLGFAFFDREQRYVRVNAVLAEINGLPAEAHIGRTVPEVVPANAEPVTLALQRVIAGGEALVTVEIDGETPARPGEPRSWLVTFFPVLDTHGAVSFVGATLVDITDRRRTEAAVRALNETLEAQVAARTAELDRVWRNSRDLIVVVDREGLLRSVSPSWTALLGHAPHEVLGRPFDRFVWSEGDVPAHRLLAADGEASFESRHRHRDGSPRWIAWRTAVQEDRVFAYGRDVTQEREKDEALARAEAALQQAQKMEAIGQLTGGIAHDFNNLLQGLSGQLQLIRRLPHDIARVQQWAENGLRAVNRGAKLTGQLLVFSRSQKLEMKPLPVAEQVADLRDLLARTLGPAVRLHFDLQARDRLALGDETQLEMAVLNLAINARDAMPDGGDLTVRTRCHAVADAQDLAAGDYIELQVSDTGTGMAPETAARAFDPFFTTKAVGKGTGLGLSQVYGLARQAHGAVRIASRLGEGTTVSLFLPCTDPGEPAREPGAAAPAPLLPAASATVLVVEDDAEVRAFLADALPALGYRALLAEDGYAGIAALERSSPDVMVVDFAMPGLNGAQVAQQARERRPGLPIVFASGFADTDALLGVPGDDTPLLRKPFQLDELQAVLQQVLRRTR